MKSEFGGVKWRKERKERKRKNVNRWKVRDLSVLVLNERSLKKMRRSVWMLLNVNGLKMKRGSDWKMIKDDVKRERDGK